jgi:hypothetical protein
MKFTVDDADLSLSVALDVEPATLDLTAGLGNRILDVAVEERIRAHARRESPGGTPWTPLRPSTVRQKGHAAIGVRSGGMLDPGRWRTAPRDLEARRATWTYPYGDLRRGRAYGQAYGFHAGNPRTGQPARPLLGGTARAQAEAMTLIRAALG